MWTYYVQHEVVPQAWCTVNSDQDAIFQGGAEADGQSVRSGAGPLVSWPVECNEASSFSKDVRRTSWTEEKEEALMIKNFLTNMRTT